MVKIKVFQIESRYSTNPNFEDKELAPMEDFIAQIGYDSIKNIIVSAPGAPCSFYTIFYENGQPYTSRVKSDGAKKKDLFG